MLSGEAEFDAEIRQALRNVKVPAGAKENLLLHLMSEAEQLAQRSQTPSYLSAADGATDCEQTVHVFSERPEAALEVRSATRPNRRYAIWIMGATVAALLLVAISFWPRIPNSRVDVLLARHIELIENEEIAWQTDVELPLAVRSVLRQVVTLQPIGLGEITPAGASYPIQIFAFRNQDGKQIWLLDMPKPRIKQQFTPLLTPLNSNTGGWSCAVAEFEGNWIVLAVPGDRAYLLKHLRNVSVT